MHYATTRNKWHIVNCTKNKRKTLISILNKLFICLGIKAYKVRLFPPPPHPKKSPKQLVVNVFKLLTNFEKEL